MNNTMPIALALMALFGCSLGAKPSLLVSIDVIRHGERSPVVEVSTQPHEWSVGLGQLLPQGEQRLIQLGQFYRKKYIEQMRHLPSHYQSKTLVIGATDYARTEASARHFLHGLYPYSYKHISDIPIHIIPRRHDKLLVVSNSDRVFDRWSLFIFESIAWLREKCVLGERRKHWETLTGLPIKNFIDVVLLADNLDIRTKHGVDLPPGFTPQDIDDISRLNDWTIANYFNRKEITDPQGHHFLAAIDKQFERTIQGQGTVKALFYFAHDSTIMSIMNTLDVPLTLSPSYGAVLNFSLYEHHGNFSVVMSYEHELIALPRCEPSSCTFKQWKNLAR